MQYATEKTEAGFFGKGKQEGRGQRQKQVPFGNDNK